MKKFFLIISIALFILCFATPQAHAGTIKTPPSLSSGLVGWWTFDGRDMVNGVLADRSGSGNHLSASGIASSTFYGNGKIGQAGYFDGSDDVFTKTNPVGLPTGQSARTIAAWIKPTDAGCSPGGGILHYGNAATAGQEFIVQCITAGPTYLFTDGVNPGNNITISGAQIPSINQWNHVVFTFDGGSAWTYYLNGVSVTSGTFSTTINTATPTILNIADRTDVVSPNRPGAMDDVRIYDRSLSTAEVSQLYRTGAAKIAESKSPGSLASGLVGHWTFDGADMWGGVARDATGNGNTGTLANIASSTFYFNGAIGQAGNFDGADDRVSIVGTPFNLGASQDFSLVAWVKTAGDSETQGIFEKRNSAGNSDGFILFVNTNGTVGMYINNTVASNTTVTSTGTVHDAVWHHITATFDRDGLGRLYIDGVLDKTGSIAATAGSLSNGTLYIGDGNVNIPASSIREFRGGIDDARFYNRILSAAEVTRLYNLGQPNKTAVTTTNKGTLSDGLISHWTFDGKDIWGGVLRNRGSSGLVGNFNSIASSTFYKSGVIGQGAVYDGSNDFVSTAAHTQLDGASQLTIAGWANMRTITSRGSIFTRWTSAVNWLTFQFTSANNINLVVGNTSTTFGTFSTGVGSNPPRTQWNHYVMVFDGTQTGNANRLKAYVNGVEVSLSFTGTIPATAPTVVANDRIGYDTHNSLSLDGSLDDVRLYNRPLSLDEIKQLYNMGR